MNHSLNAGLPIVLLVLALFPNEGGMRDIRHAVAEINHGTGYSVVTMTGSDMPERSSAATLTGYFRDDELVRIIERLLLPGNIGIVEYYFHNGKLIFVLDIEVTRPAADTAGFEPQSRVVRAGSYYFEGGRLIEMREVGSRRTAAQTDADRVVELLSTAQRYAEWLYALRERSTTGNR